MYKLKFYDGQYQIINDYDFVVASTKNPLNIISLMSRMRVESLVKEMIVLKHVGEIEEINRIKSVLRFHQLLIRVAEPLPSEQE